MLNEKQQKAVTAKDRFIFLLAGAGSGKTRVIIERIKYLLENNITTEEKILAISFTRKSANELKERLNRENIKSQTFHSFCLSYLSNKKIIELNTYSSEELLEISKYKNSLFKNKKPSTYNAYQKELTSKDSIDFDDILLKFLELDSVPTFDYIFIDEFQDTNKLQYEVLKKLIKENTRVFAVGDPDQSIYAFRGSDMKIIDRYIKDYNAKIYLLDLNYRCNKNILSAANILITNNTKRFNKALYPYKNKEGEAQIILTEDKFKAVESILKKEGFTTILTRNYHNDIGLKEFLDKTYTSSYELMTIHQSKGLEFDKVIILGTYEMSQVTTQRELEEERRLLFVGITRAKEKVFIIEDKKNSLLSKIKIEK